MSSGKKQVDWVALSILKTGSYLEPLWWRVPEPPAGAEMLAQRHAEFDGVGWFAHLIREKYGVLIEKLPVMPGARPSPPLWRLILPALRCAKAVWLAPSAARWKNFDTDASIQPGEIPSCKAWRVLSREETEQVLRRASKERVSLNALGLWAMNQALQESLIPGSGPMLWSIPVNMRGCISMEDPNANHVSGVEACTPANASAAGIYEALLEAFRNNDHWVAWHTLTLGKWFGPLGPVIFEWVALRKSRRLTGSFSFLGSWPPPGVEIPKPDHAWCCTSIARLERPLGVGMLVWLGRLSIGLIAHPALSRDARQAERWLTSWKSHILSEGSDPAA